jgi:hypothetical protein
MCNKDSKFSGIWTNEQFPAPDTVVVTNIVEDLWSTYVDEMASFLPDLEKAAMSLESSDNPEKEISEVKRIQHSKKAARHTLSKPIWAINCSTKLPNSDS